MVRGGLGRRWNLRKGKRETSAVTVSRAEGEGGRVGKWEEAARPSTYGYLWPEAMKVRFFLTDLLFYA